MPTISINNPIARKLYVAFKYAVYTLLCINVYLFLTDEIAASSHMFADGITLSKIIEGYAATIDTAAWVILLLLFELETDVIPDEKIKGWVKYIMHWVRWLCFAFIVYALYGYIAKLIGLMGFEPTSISNLCSQAIDYSYLITLDEFTTVAAANCNELASNQYLQLPNSSIIASTDTLDAAKWLAWIDVINASNWVLIVIMLEVDVRIQLRRKIALTWEKISLVLKIVLYSTLFICAILWGIDGSFLDTWDASLWLIAFIFIEMNIFDWQEEITAQEA